MTIRESSIEEMRETHDRWCVVCTHTGYRCAEKRLYAEVDRLQDAIVHHQEQVTSWNIVNREPAPADAELWAVLEVDIEAPPRCTDPACTDPDHRDADERWCDVHGRWAIGNPCDA